MNLNLMDPKLIAARSRSGSGNRRCRRAVHAETQEDHGGTARPFRAGIRPGRSNNMAPNAKLKPSWRTVKRGLNS